MGNSFYFGKKDGLSGRQYRSGTLGRAIKDAYGDVDQAILGLESRHIGLLDGPVSNDFCLESGGTIALPWKKDTLETLGTPTVDFVDGKSTGWIKAACEATDEAMEARLSWNDKKYIQPGVSGCIVEMGVVMSPQAAAYNAAAAVFVGLGSTYNATWASIADHVAFNVAGGGLVASLDHDDGTTDASIADAFTFTKDALTRIVFDLRNMSKVDVYIGLYGAKLTKVGNALSMAGVTGTDGLQPIMVVQKSESAATDAVIMDYCKVWAVGRS